jgi:dTDP-4-dehydrorhamnose reductase
MGENLLIKKVLIFGGSGLLAINWALSAKNEFSIILGLNKREIILEDTKTIKFDFSSFEELNIKIDQIRPDIIVNTIAITSVEKCEQNPKLAFETNVKIASFLAQIASKIQCKLVHISTDMLYNGTQSYMNELLDVSPLNIYGETKYRAELEVIKHNSTALIIRTNFYGWGPTYRASFSDTIINSLKSGKEINLFVDVFFTPILIQNLVLYIHELIEKSASGIYNVVSDDRISKFDFGILVAREFELNEILIKPIQFSNQVGLVKRPLDMSLSNGKTVKKLGHKLGSVKEHLKLLNKLKMTSEIL